LTVLTYVSSNARWSTYLDNSFAVGELTAWWRAVGASLGFSGQRASCRSIHGRRRFIVVIAIIIKQEILLFLLAA
jgi:hypothetical protein